MRLLFIHHDYSPMKRKGERVQCLGPMILSSVLERCGHTVEHVENNYESIKKELKKEIPTVVGFSMHIFSAAHLIKTNRRIKDDFDVLTLCGGPQATFHPQLMEREPFDGLCIGEGDEALLELMNHLEEGKDIKGLRNWWIREDGPSTRSSSSRSSIAACRRQTA